MILIQPGKGDMISGMSGIGGQFNQVLGTGRATSFLTKVTWGLAGSIILLALVINIVFVGSGENNIRKAPTEGKAIPVNTAPAPAATPIQTAPTESAPVETQESNNSEEN